MKIKNIFLLLPIPFLAGCWAISDVRTNRELDKALPYHSRVAARTFSGSTPESNMLIVKNDSSLVFRTVDLGTIPPETYAALPNTRSQFDKVVEADKRNAALFKTYDTEIRGKPAKIYLARSNKGDVVRLVYYAYIQVGATGYSAEYTAYYYSTAFQGDAWWDKVPETFSDFINSLEFQNGG